MAPLVRKSGCFGCLFSGSVGCLAFITGSVAAALIFAPNILGGSAARLIEKALGRKWDGRLEITSMDLAWTRPQTLSGVRLFDPSGDEVLRGSLSLPGFLKWERSEGLFRASVDLAELNVHRDLEGVSGLARAVGRGDLPWPQAPLDWELAEFRAQDGLRQDRPYELNWNLELGQWRDDRRPDFLLRLYGVSGKVTHSAAGETVLTATGQVSLSGVEGEFDVLWERAPDGQLGGHVIGEDLPIGVFEELLHGLVDLPLWCGESVDLSLLLGDRALLAAEQQPAPGEGVALLVELNSEQAQGRLLGRWSEGQVLAGAGGLATFEAQLPAELCRQFGARALPRNLALEPNGQPTWLWSAREFAWPLWNADAGARSSYTVQGKVLGGLTLTDGAGQDLAQLADGGFELTKSSSTPAQLFTSVSLRPTAADAGQPGARVEYGLRSDTEGAWPWAGEEVSYALDGFGLRGATLDKVLGLDGLLAELFGEQLEVQLSGKLRSAQTTPHTLSLASRGGLSIDGLEFQDGRLRFARGETRKLELPLGPQLARVLLQPALPLLVTLEPISKVLRLEATDLELAWREGRAYMTAGELVFDPGEVNALLHPGLAGLFEAQPQPGPSALILLPVRVRAEGGLLRYSELTLPLAGEECDLVGTYDRDTGHLDLATEATLLVAAHKLALPEGVRSVLADSAYVMEMSIGGTLGEPTLSFTAEVVGEFMIGGLQQLLRGTPIALLNGALQSLIEKDD